MRTIRAALLAFLTLAISSQSYAAILIEYSQVGPDVVFNYSGSFNVDSFDNGIFRETGILANHHGSGDGERFRSFLPSGFGRIASSIVFTGSSSNWAPGLGTGDYEDATGTGDTFAMDFFDGGLAYLYSPQDYVAGTAISGSLALHNFTLDAVGIVDSVWDFGAPGTITLRSASVGVVPVPAAAWLFGSALLSLGAMKRQKA